MTDDRVAADAQSKRGLQLPPHGQNWPATFKRQTDRLRCIPARAPDEQLGPLETAGYRIVTSYVDRTIMPQDYIGNVAETQDGIIVQISNGLVTAVSAGHYQRSAIHRLQQQIMQRRVREHDAQQ